MRQVNIVDSFGNSHWIDGDDFYEDKKEKSVEVRQNGVLVAVVKDFKSVIVYDKVEEIELKNVPSHDKVEEMLKEQVEHPERFESGEIEA